MAPLPERQRATGADVPARGDPPRAAPLPSPRGAARARIPGGQVRPGPLTPVMTAASPAGGVSSSGGSSSRSSSGAQRGPLMAPSGLRGGWGPLGAPGRGALAGARSGGRADWRAAGASLRAVIKASPAVTHAGARPAARAGGTARAHTPRPHAHTRAHPAGGPGTSTCRRAAPRAPAPGATQAAPPAGRPAPGPRLASRLPPLASARRRLSHAPQPLCGLRHARSMSWFPKLHVLGAGAENLQLICCADVQGAPTTCQAVRHPGARGGEGREPPNPFICSAGLHRAPAACQVLATAVWPHGPITAQKRHTSNK